MSHLQDKVAIVTGAGRGVGAATARLLASEGALVAVNDLDAEAAEETTNAIDGLAIPGSVTDLIFLWVITDDLRRVWHD